MLHKRYFKDTLSSVRPLPGSKFSPESLVTAEDSLGDCDRRQQGHRTEDDPVPAHSRAAIPVITPPTMSNRPSFSDPDVFLIAARALGVALSDCIVVGDSIWDLLGARRAKALGVGLRLRRLWRGGTLVQAGAYRVYKDPADLLDHLPEVGISLE